MWHLKIPMIASHLHFKKGLFLISTLNSPLSDIHDGAVAMVPSLLNCFLWAKVGLYVDWSFQKWGYQLIDAPTSKRLTKSTSIFIVINQQTKNNLGLCHIIFGAWQNILLRDATCWHVCFPTLNLTLTLELLYLDLPESKQITGNILAKASFFFISIRKYVWISFYHLS